MGRVRKGDEVVVIAGKDLGKRGKVLSVDPKKKRVKVERVQVVKKHVRPSQREPQGGIVEREAFIAISNVQLWDAKAQARCRTGIKRLEDGRRVRVSKKSGETLD